jgi:Histidine kinase-, DNA gyrase B-, and HSP90-like ATPase
MGQTRVDLLHLLEDLRDAYPGSLEETLLTEIVANSLDSGARRIVLTTDPAQSALLILDDGAGMKRAELARYHDVAASRKSRGEGIGFAGVGIKLGLLASDVVVTETRRGAVHIATRWHLASRQRAPWKWMPPGGLLSADGTAVTLRLSNLLSPLLDAGFLEETMRRHFQPLFDAGFSQTLGAHYPEGVSVVINGRTLGPEEPALVERSLLALRLARHRRAAASGYLWRGRQDGPLPEAGRGLAVSTFGKVIKRGWDWLGVFPADPDRVGGLVEAPLLSQCLTLAKNDFIRTGQKGAVFLAFRKALQQAVSAQLSAWGEGTDRAEPRVRRARPYERDLAAVLEELAEEFPLLQSLVERHAGGQKTLPAGGAGSGTTLLTAGTAPLPESGPAPASEEPPAEPPLPAPPAAPPSELAETPTIELAAADRRGRSKPTRLGLKLQFELRPESIEPGRLAENIVWINESHPAYRRAAASRSEGYHIAFSAAMALSTVAVEPHQQRAFVNAFLARWGEALLRSAGRSPRSKQRRSAGGKE